MPQGSVPMRILTEACRSFPMVASADSEAQRISVGQAVAFR